MEQYFFTASAFDISLTFDTKHGSCRRVCSDRLEYTNASPLSPRSSPCTLTYPLTQRMSNLGSTHSVKMNWTRKEGRSADMTRYKQFGRGPRTCLGKNISLMEMNKLIPELVLRFDIEMAEKDAEWTVYNDWFVKQEGFRVKISKRQETTVLL